MVGKALTSYALAALPPWPSHQCVQGISVLSRKSFNVSRCASQLTLTKTSGFLSYCLTTSRVCGIIARQGPHHVAQKSSTTTLPARSLSFTDVPLTSWHVVSGALAPTFSLSLSSFGSSSFVASTSE